jgi:hypothetical protein
MYFNALSVSKIKQITLISITIQILLLA